MRLGPGESREREGERKKEGVDGKKVERENYPQ